MSQSLTLAEVVIPDSVREYLGKAPETFTLGFCVQQLLDTQALIGKTLRAENEAGRLLKARFGTLPLDLMPVANGLKFAPISEAEQHLFDACAPSREAGACMGMPFSLESWHLPGKGGDAFSGPHGRMAPGAKLDLVHLPMMASIFGFTGVAFHTWLDVHPDDLRAYSLNLLARKSRINSAFHGAFHGPIFSRGAMASDFSEVRYLAHLLKLEGQLITLLGWDAATAIEERLVAYLGGEEINKLRARVQADLSDDVVGNVLKKVQAGEGNLRDVLVAALKTAGIAGEIEQAVDRVLSWPVDADGRQCCDWDGTCGQLLHESLVKPAIHLDLSADELRPSVRQAQAGMVRLPDDTPITKLDLLVFEKAVRIVVTGGRVAIKIEPKVFDPSEMVEADADVVNLIAERVERLIREWLTAKVRTEDPTNVDWDKSVDALYAMYANCIAGQIEEGHAVQLNAKTGSRQIEILLSGGTLANAFHENFAPVGTGYGDPDFSAVVTLDSVRRHYFLIAAGLVGPNSNPSKRIATEFDMAPHHWDGVYGFLASINAVNTSIGIALNLRRIEAAMQKRGELDAWESDVQRRIGVLQPSQGIFSALDSGVIHNALSLAFGMNVEGLLLIPVAENTRQFREMIGRPNHEALPTAAIRAMVA